MNKLTHSLIGWGIDYLYILCNGIDKKKSYAIIHKIICENPKEENKKIQFRELSLINYYQNRKHIWNNFSKIYNIPNQFDIISYESIPLKT